MVVGIDEVGRGCLAGPLLVVAARPLIKHPGGLKDSKQLSRRQRLEIFAELHKYFEFGEGWVSADKISKVGLAQAMRIGTEKALKNLSVSSGQAIIMDGGVNYCPPVFKNVKCLVKADSKVPVVSAASIYAKIRRDEFMTKLSQQYPEYYFENHVGYGTKRHLEAITRHGVLAGVHRMNYEPIAKLL